MAERGFTPGPWWPYKNTAGGWCVATYRDGEEPPASIPPGYDLGANMCSCIGDHTEKRTRGNEEANARLIAASPTLLEALETVVSDCQLAIDALGNSSAQFDSVRKGFGIIADRARAAITLATGKDA